MDLFMMNCELLAVCSALGYLEGDTYYKEEDCIDQVKCLIKYLQNEDSTRDIRTQLGAAHILQNDLLPILTQNYDDPDLFSCVLRLVINLTQPALLCFNGKVPKDTVMHYHFLNVVSYNQDYKEAFGKNDEIWNVLREKIHQVLEVSWEDRKPEQSLLVERCLVLLRNLLHTPATTEDFRKTSQEMSSQDSLIWKTHSSNLDDLILYMVGSNDETQWMLHLIEIICLILKEQNAVQLAKVGQTSSSSKEGGDLQAMRKTEETRRKLARAKLTARHSRFGGTYVARGTKALNDDNSVIMHRSLQHCKEMSFDEGKNPVRKARNRRAILDEVIERHSSRGISKILSSFCRGFLERGYNLCMRVTKDRLQREGAHQDHDETFYFWMMSFFLKFNRLTDFKVEYVSETLNLQTLHFIDTNLLNYYELMLNDKHDAQAWSRRLHLALRCYQEFLYSVQFMSHSEDVNLKNSAKVLLNNIFYVVEHREIFVVILRKFDERKQCRAFLRDAVLTTHLFLKMFETFCKDGKVVVETKGRKQQKKRKVAGKKKSLHPDNYPDNKSRMSKWEEIREQVENYLQEKDLSLHPANIKVFDAASHLTENQQQQVSLLNIQKYLTNGEISNGVTQYLSSQQIWPESGLFGTSNSNVEEQTKNFQEILKADLSGVVALVEPSVDIQTEESDNEEQEINNLRRTKQEIEFDYEEYIKKFADSNVVRSYATLLNSYESNGHHLNHCIVKMLHRIAYQLKMYGFLFQASIFRTFQQIHATSKFDQSYREIVVLGNWVLKKFFEVFKKNPSVVAELLFWKHNATQCLEIAGHVVKKDKNRSWSSKEVEELHVLFEKHKEKLSDGSIMNAIMSEISDETRTMQDVKKQLVKRGLVEDIKMLKQNKSALNTGVWRPDDVEELREVYSSCKDDCDVIGGMIPLMRKTRPRQKIANKLLELGIIADKRQLTKRRTNKKTREEVAADQEGESSDNSDDESDNDCEEYEHLSVTSLIGQLRHNEESDVISDCFRWLSSSLQQAVATGETDTQLSSPSQHLDSIPLVPFTEHQENLIGNPAFKTVLKKIGLQAPNNDQIFWRIPKDADVAEINRIIELLRVDDASKYDDVARPRGGVAKDKKDDDVTMNKKVLHSSTSSLQIDDSPTTSPQYRELPPSETAKQDLRDSDSGDDVVVRKKRKFRFDDSDDDE